jgi:hypothetical protein
MSRTAIINMIRAANPMKGRLKGKDNDRQHPPQTGRRGLPESTMRRAAEKEEREQTTAARGQSITADPSTQTSPINQGGEISTTK